MSEENEKVLNYKSLISIYLLLQYKAILFFNQKYKSQPTLDGVESDEKELTEVLKKYKKESFNNSENVLNSLKELVEHLDKNKKKFERVHFHFSGKIKTKSITKFDKDIINF